MADLSTGLWLGTVIFIAIGIVLGFLLSFYVRSSTKDATMKVSNCMMTFWLTLFAFFLMWVMWSTSFVHQMYPMVRPTLTKPSFRMLCPHQTNPYSNNPDICYFTGPAYDEATNKTLWPCDFFKYTSNALSETDTLYYT